MVNDCHFIYHFTSYKYKDLFLKKAAASNLSRKTLQQSDKEGERNEFFSTEI